MLIPDGKAALFHHDAQQRALLACVGASHQDFEQLPDPR